MKPPELVTTRPAQPDRMASAIAAARPARGTPVHAAGSAVRRPWPYAAQARAEWLAGLALAAAPSVPAASRRGGLARVATGAATLCAILAPGIAAAQTFSGPANAYPRFNTPLNKPRLIRHFRLPLRPSGTTSA
jgi:hypothetical protein